MPRVSVILNSYNQAAYLRQAVESVLAQSFDDLELLAVDNGSTDGSAAILAEYAGDPRMRIFAHDENEAISRRFNQAVDAAQGELVGFLYSDDFLLPEKIAKQVAEFDRLPSDYGVVYGPALGLNEDTGATWTYGSFAASGDVFRPQLLCYARGQIDMVSPLTRRAALIEHRFDESLFAEGEAVFLRIALTHRFSFIPEALAVLRDHGGNAGKAIVRNRETTMRVLASLREDPRLAAEDISAINRYAGVVLRSYGWQAARLGGDPGWTRECLRNAVRNSPRSAAHPKWALSWVLSALPSGLRTAVNDLGHRLRRAPGNPSYVAEYPGLADSAHEPGRPPET